MIGIAEAPLGCAGQCISDETKQRDQRYPRETLCIDERFDTEQSFEARRSA
jgi:hypothetical protein